LPPSSWTPHPMMDNGVDATFYRAAADRIAFCPKIVIAHSLLL